MEEEKNISDKYYVDDLADMVVDTSESKNGGGDNVLGQGSYYKPPKNPSKRGIKVSVWLLVVCVILSAVSGGVGGYFASRALQTGNGGSGNVIMYESVIRNVSDSDDADFALTVSEVNELTEDSVVEITTEQLVTSSYYGQYITNGAGSGVVFSSDGYIVTNNHVIDGATKITVTLHNNEQYEATLVATDEKTDLAVLKIDAKDLVPVILGDSSELKTGESVVVIGNPLGSLGGSVSSGIISAMDREVLIDNNTMTLLQTDAAVNPGNSGGGMFNMYGELVGIVNAKGSGSDIDNLGFAIPINTAKDVVEQLVSVGYVQNRAYLGISMVEISSSYAAMQYRVNELGVYVATVTSGSAADKAGMKTGDRIVKIGDSDISSASDVSAALDKYRAGDSTEIVVKRDSKELTLDVVFDEYVPESVSDK